MFSNAGKQKKGFTLVEVIVTLTIVGILAAIAIPSGIGYMENAKQTARDKVARSVFLAAQKALTSRMSSGDKLTSGSKVETVKIPGFADEANKENIVYLSINQKTQDKNGQELYMLLDPYLTDKEILENTVLVEFNKKTGKVYSAFYSEVVSEIGYGTNAGSQGYDAFKRSKKERKDGKMGYWGVDSTGTLDGDEENVKADISLVDYDEPAGLGDEGKGNNINGGKNYGLLTVECTLPSAAELEKTESITLTLKGAGTESIAIKNDVTTPAGNVITLGEIALRTDVDSALKNPFKIQEGNAIKNYPLYIETKDDGRRILVWVLDSQAKGMGLYENHSTLGTGTITAEMKLQGQDAQTYEAKPVHGLFAKEYSDQGKTAYGIKSVRHLSNIRYTARDVSKVYVQSDNFACRDYNDVPIEWEPIGEQGPVRIFAGGGEDKTQYSWGKTHGFFGTYKGEKHTIYDLTISGNSESVYGMAGLFSCISAKGSVENVELNYSKAYWGDYGLEDKYFICGPDRVGGITGENWGRISLCTVQGKIYSAGGETKAGGLVGKNMGGTNADDGPGLITQCVSAVDVKAEAPKFPSEGALAGGIAGDNYGQITFCESGTAAKLQNGRGQIVAEPYFGVNTDLSRSSLDTLKAGYKGNAENNVFTISGTEFAGGIAGEIRASEFGISPKIQYCVNAAKVVSGSGSAGGLAGCYFSQFQGKPIRIQWSYNAGDVQGDKLSGGIFGTYKTGLKPLGTDYNLIQSCYNTGKVLTTGSDGMAGGVAGTYGMYTEIWDCYNIGKVSSNASNKADGIVCDRDGTREIKNCAAFDTAPQCWPGNKTNTGRLFLPAEMLKTRPFGDLSPGKEKGVGPFAYPYPYLVVTEVDKENCGLGDAFHRTEFKD